MATQQCDTGVIESMVDERIDGKMKELLVNALQAALVPLAENFEHQMAAFEARVFAVHDT